MKLQFLKTAFTGFILIASSLANAGLITLSETQSQTVDFQNFTFDWVISDWAAGTSAELTIELQADLGQSGELAFIDIESVTLGSHGEFSLGLDGWSPVTVGGINGWRVDRTFIITSADMAAILADDIFKLSVNYTTNADFGNGVALAYGSLGGVAPYVKVDVAYSNIATVPETSTLAIFALGLMGLASRRFKKQS